MRLGFHYHIPAIERNGNVAMPGFLGLFVESLAEKCESVVCFSHAPKATELIQMDYEIRASNVRLVNIGPHSSIPQRTASAFFNRGVIRKWQSDLDIMLVRVPTPLLPVLRLTWRKPMALLVVGDLITGLESLPSLTWHQRVEGVWARWNYSHQLKAAKQSLTLVNSRVLFDKLRTTVPNLVETQTTTLNAQDFFYRADTCLTQPYRLLYAGRMTTGKGLDVIVSALARLVAEGFDVVLDLVGMRDKRDPVFDESLMLARSLGVEKRIVYYGYKTAGTELLSYFRNADIFVMASEAEGFPRTIWEAMASSLPVVATNVGSIPAFAGEAALIIPSRNTDALTEALRRLMTTPSLRQELIKSGMRLARNNTLDKRTEELISHVRVWLESRATQSPVRSR